MPGQTLSEIRALLAAAGLRPRHRLGQNFLIDLNLMRKLVAAAQPSPGDVVLEVGAGTGSLTEMLLDRGAHVVAVEVDRGLAALLRKRLENRPALTLIEADALAGKHRLNPRIHEALAARAAAPGGRRMLVSNLPYQIATPLLIDLLCDTPPLDRIVCTIQKEVGERLTARPRSAAYGPVSVLAESLATVEQLALFKPEAFWPRPKVESVMVRLTPHPPERVELDELPAFAAFVHQAFQQRRKMLRRLARQREDGPALLAALQRLGISPQARPEELSAPQWRSLFRALRRPSG